MLGVFIGAAAVFAYFKFFRHGGWRRFGPGGYGQGHRWARDGRRRWMTRWMFERLGTSPGQEKVILESLDEVQEKAWALKDEWRRAKTDVARAIRAPTLDAAALAEAQTRQEGALSALRESFKAQLAKVHEALDDRQRRELADLVELGPRWGRHHADRW